MLKRAFTLIELLVVIAIIAILAAILFPVFAQAKTSAKITANLSNIKQDNLANLMYAADVDDMLPPTNTGAYLTDYIVNVTRAQLVQPYSKNWNIQRNPLDPNANDTTLKAGATIVKEQEYNMGLRSNRGWNYFYLSPLMDVGGLAVFMPKTATAITRPAQTIMTTDSLWDKAGTSPAGGGNWFVQAPSYWNSGTTYWFGPWAFTDNTSWFQYGGSYDYSKGRVGVSFVDGHAKTLPTTALWAGANPATSSVFNEEQYLWGGHTN
ncbi:MAG: prepilin-type N-terminal cleavage/methylation domain-containing protein [Fimbriimonas sp.]